jgi:hypothetical protein
MKRSTRRKLTLDPETLVTLSSEALALAVGGVVSRAAFKMTENELSWCNCGPPR